MTKYYTNKPDFSGDPTYPLVSSDSYFKSMSSIMDDIEAAGKVVKDEGVEDLYSQTGEASLGTTKDSTDLQHVNECQEDSFGYHAEHRQQIHQRDG